MGMHVYANGNAVACKAGDGKVIAAFPDVCNSPPSPPAGPIPIPYPDTSQSSDLKEGSSTVKIGGKPAALKGQSYFGSSPLGDEAATKTFGGSLVSHTITGTTWFQAASMDVKFEGKNVCRHLDITTSNHASEPGSTPPIPEAEDMNPAAGAAAIEEPKCECCGKAMHSAAQAAGQEISEADFYTPKGGKGGPPGFAQEAGPLLKEIRSGPCKNILPPANPGPKTKCAKYYITTPKEKRRTENAWNAYKAKYMRKNKLPAGMGVSHRVPKSGGGCATGWGNLTPTAPECDKYESQLANIQERAVSYHRKVLGIA
jgi:uncharacterized Zn-binding protein involved in type VI secretion